jgi:predicted AAA+ superfamily ATPase
MNIIEKHIDTPVIKVISGIRRCGKSYLLKLFKELLNKKGINNSRIILINFESLKFEEYRNYKSLYKYISNKIGNIDEKVYILIDEIQEAENWEKAVRSLTTDFDCDIYLTGSNANLLSGELATHLAGRYIEIEMYPLSFKEYLDFYDVDQDSKANIESSFSNYLKFGGFPALSSLPNDDDIKTNYLKGIYNSVVLKDVITRNNIRDSEMLVRILQYIMDCAGQTFSAKKIANYLKNQGRKVSVDTVYNYINALENAMIIYTAKRYDIKGKKILDRMEKYFITDLGIRYCTIGYKKNDISQLLENVVYFELKRRGYTVYVGKEDDFEVDFIAEKQGKKVYIQVCYLLANTDVIEREFRPLQQIKDNYKKIVLSMDSISDFSHNGIEWINLIEFLIIK